MKKIFNLLLLLGLMVSGYAFADGGFGMRTCYITKPCPAGQKGSIVYTVTASSRVIDNCGDAQRMFDRGSLTSRSVANSCVAAGPTVVGTQSESQSLACQAATPSGTWTQSRTYTLWSDGSRTAYSAWSNTAYTCTAIRQSVQTESQNLSCPAAQPSGSLIQSRTYEVWSDGSVKNYSGWSITTNSCTAIRQSTQTESQALTCPSTQPSGTLIQSRNYDIYTDGSVRNYTGWVITTNTCAAIKKSTQVQNQTLTCPATHPSGTWTQTRNYDLWTDGSTKNFTPWVNTSYTCKAIVASNEIEKRASTCPTGQTGTIEQSRNYQKWTDGSITYTSGWTVSNNVCKANDIVADTTKRPEACPEGYTGKKTYKFVIKYKDVSYEVKDVDGNSITYVLSTPYQEEVLDTNTCTLIPTTQTVSNPGSQTISCNAYYGTSVGTTNGEVIKYGDNVSTYSSVTKSTTTVFIPNGNIDTTGCTSAVSSVEYKDGVCDNGQTGTQVLYSYVTTVNGVKKYDGWKVFSNTCKAPDDLAKIELPEQNKKEVSLISNMSLTSSQLINKDVFNTFLTSIKSQNWKAKEGHTLNLIIDDLSKNTYDANKVTQALSSFKSVVGTQYSSVKIVSIPKDITKYKGYRGLTNIENKRFKNATIDSNNIVKLEYIDLSQKDSTGVPKTSTVSIPLFNNTNMNSSIKSNDRSI